MKDYIRTIIDNQKHGVLSAIPSYCTANKLVIEAILEQGKRFDSPILLEATANQVNQFGGYTGMKPSDFRDFVWSIAADVGFPRERIILGGDHLGPLTWQKLPEKEAMLNSVELVSQFVLAGFKKIHLDTSMRVADDPTDKVLKNSTIARRGAILYKACEDAYKKLLTKNPSEIKPAYVIGSEVPIPGGAQESDDSICVTKPQDLDRTLKAYEKAFSKLGIKDAFENIIGVVVQPGVEFCDDNAFIYNREKAKALTSFARTRKGIVLEGHSTDYQSARALKEMAEDGIAILKVGPALTFGLREGLFALSYMEKILVPEKKRANVIETLEKNMLKNPGNWINHYHGTGDELRVKRMFSYSDRCRYYLTQPELVSAIEKLFENMDIVDIPIGMLHQFMPYQYFKVRDGRLAKNPRSLVKDCVVAIIEDYNHASKFGYEIANTRIC